MITYGFATVGKANVQKALLFVTALFRNQQPPQNYSYCKNEKCGTISPI
ncbi:hypothetical protein P7M46_07000 [Bisgaard Taxon 10/6]|nr:hypothetical protein [Exercitatus varius]MDG2917752.1 hypothetical protein [Exercitatus varius]